ncbi:MAG: site-specific integrase [Ktedonobacteraceae bacterium]
MSTTISPTQQEALLSHIRKVAGKPDDLYEMVFVNQHGLPIVPLTEWYRLRKHAGPESTRNTYLACLQPFLSYLEDQSCPWNAPPEQLRPVLIAFHRDRLRCQIHPGKDGESIEIVPTRDTPLCPSTLRVFRAALRDFYLVLKDAGLYAFPNPLSSEVLIALKREQTRSIANSGAPDQAGIRGETREQSRRRPTAFIRHPTAQEWRPELRKELADVRAGMHKVLNALLDSKQVSPREKAILELLQNTGARLHEVVLMTVGGYRNEGVAGQARVVNKGSMGREVKTIYFAHNPKVERALTAYINHIRPLSDPQARKRLAEVGDQEPLFLTERGSAYAPKTFYWHWYKHYELLQHLCPVRFSPHDLRHLFITEYLIRLKQACRSESDQFREEDYLQAREAFGSLVMGWRSVNTINIYDHSRNGEAALSVLADYQNDLSKRCYISSPLTVPESIEQTLQQPNQEEATKHPCEETVWVHDAETLDWIKKLQQQAKQEGQEG